MARLREGAMGIQPERKPATDDIVRVAPPHDVEEMGILRELWAFLRVRKKFWLAPIILAMLALGLLFFVAGQASVLSPFVYSLF